MKLGNTGRFHFNGRFGRFDINRSFNGKFDITKA